MKPPIEVKVVRDQNAGKVHLQFLGSDSEILAVTMDDTRSLYDGLHGVQGELGELVTSLIPTDTRNADRPPPAEPARTSEHEEPHE